MREEGLNYCPVCGRRFVHEVEIHGHIGITTSNLRTDWRDAHGTLMFSFEGMMAQLRMMGYLAPTSLFHGMAATGVLDVLARRHGARP